MRVSGSFAYMIRTDEGWRQVAIVRGSDTRKIMERHYRQGHSAGIDYKLVSLADN